MAGYAATWELNAAGPWGTVAWLVVGTVITVGMAVTANKVREKAKRDAATTSTTGTKTETCKYYWTRIHAQGEDCGGTTKSTIGIPGGINQPTPVLVAQALALSKATQALLTRTQLANRSMQIVAVEAYILAGPVLGGRDPDKKSFVNRKLPGGIRYDIDHGGCGRNFIA